MVMRLNAPDVPDINNFFNAFDRRNEINFQNRQRNALADAGSRVAQGDLQGGRNVALEAGNFPAAAQIGQMIKSKSDAELQVEQRRMQKFSRAVAAARTPEQFASLIAAAEARGETFEPWEKDFRNRDMILGQFQTVSQILDREFKERQFAQDERFNNQKLDIARLKASQSSAKQQQKAGELQQGGQQVLGAVDQLEAKIGLPGSKQESAFESATGPIDDTALGRTIQAFAPFQGDNLTLLKSVKQDAQAINTLMQRALLKGGGSITENEREQINQILGGISKSTDANQARALLQNFRQLVGSIFGLDDTQPQQQATQDPANQLPQDAQQIGTSGGKPVYQTPDGRTFIQD